MRRILFAVPLVLLAACGQEGRPVAELAQASPSPNAAISPTPGPTDTPEPAPTEDAPTPGPKEPDETEEPEATPGSWERTDEGDFSFEVRSDLKKQESHPLDSQVGGWRGERGAVSYDYGWYSGDHGKDENTADYKDQWTRIDGRLAHIGYWRYTGPRDEDDPTSEFRYVGAVYFPNVNDTDDASPTPSGEASSQVTKLILHVYDEATWDDAEHVIESIRFDG
jgi:hypothetical protein